MKNTKYQELLKKTKESQYLLMEIPHYNEDLYQQYESMIDELEDFASREKEFFQDLCADKNEFIDFIIDHVRGQLNSTNLEASVKEEVARSYKYRANEYFPIFDKIQNEEIYRIIEDPEIDEYPLDRFFEEVIDRFFEEVNFHKK